MMAMVMVIGFLGFFVWAHHMFPTGLGSIFNIIFAGSTMVIAVPTGVKIFNWLATMWGGALRFNTPLYFTSGFIALFTIGGLTGVTPGGVPFDWQVSDSYYLVAHFHNTLFGGTLFGVMAGVFYWFPKVTGRLTDEKLGKLFLVPLHRVHTSRSCPCTRGAARDAPPRVHLGARMRLGTVQPALLARRFRHRRGVG